MKRCAGIFICIVLLHPIGFCRSINHVQNGVIDLRNHSWQKDGIVNISGNWEFYWDKLYSPDFFSNSNFYKKQFALVPDFWNKYITENKFSHTGFGYATYHVKILCPDSSQQLALKLMTVQGAYNLFVNNKKIAEAGKVDSVESNGVTALKPVTIHIQPLNNVVDIVIQVSNFNDHEGGIWDRIFIGDEDQIQSYTIKNISIDFIIAGIFLLAFIYNLILFLHFKDRFALLFFAALCFIIFIRILVTGEIPINYIYNVNWELVRRLEYVSFYFSVPVMSLFSYFLFPKDFRKKILYIVLPVGCAFIIISLFASYYIYTYIVRYYQVYMILTAFYGLFVYIKAALKKRPGSQFFLVGFIIFLATIINDVLSVNLVINTIPLFYAGLMLFVVTLCIILSKQFAEIFSDVEKANQQLANANKTLATMNNDIEIKNAELKKINNELDIFVHRASHDLRAPLSSVKGVTYLMESETNISVLHDYALLQQKTLQRMDGLIQDLIDLSKSKRLTLSYEEVNFLHLVNNSLEDHKHIHNGIDIKKEVIVHQLEKFISDTRHINTIINNLISNAIKYSDLSKQEPKIIVKVNVTDNNAFIDITDNGIGIEEFHIDKLFTMFYRANNNITGSGLGLYITKETVKKLNGRISIKSKKGDGTQINVVIPGKLEN